jgi:uncharacterized protein YceK
MRVIFVIGIVCLLSGCAAWRHTPASCDGGERRVMNKGMWDEQMSLGRCSDALMPMQWGHQ